MQAVILAGGEGARLQPLTSNRPKPLVEIANTPILTHVLDLLRRHDIVDAIVTVHYLADMVKAACQDGARHGVRLSYAHEDKPLGTAGGVKRLEGRLGEAPFVVVSGDALTDIDLTAAVRFHQEKGAMATVVLSAVTDPRPYGVVVTDVDGRVRRFVEKPSWGQVLSDTVSTGIYVLDPAVLRYLEPDQPADFARDLFPRLLSAGVAIYGFRAGGYWCDVGTLTTYRRAQWDALTGRVRVNLPASLERDGIWIGPGASVASTAVLLGPVLIGAGCRIGERTRIGPRVVLGEGATVGEGAVIEQTIVGGASVIEAGAQLYGSIVGRQVRIAAAARLEEGAVLGDECLVEERASVAAGVKLWPGRRVQRGERYGYAAHRPWSAERSLFGARGAGGETHVECTPAFGVRFGEAVGASLPRDAAFAVACDGEAASRGIAQAAIAGLMATGIRVYDLRRLPSWLVRHAVRGLGARGGLYVRRDAEEPGATRVLLFDERGIDLDPSATRHIEEWFLREDGRLRPPAQAGDLCAGLSGLAAYRRVAKAGVKRAGRWGRRLVLAAEPLVARWAKRLLGGLGGVTWCAGPPSEGEPTGALQESVAAAVFAGQADLGGCLDRGGERITLIDERGRTLEGPRLLAVMIELALRLRPGAAVAVPQSAPDAVEAIAALHGARVVRTRQALSALMEAVAVDPAQWALAGDERGHFIIPAAGPCPDALSALLMVLDALGEVRLADVAAALPPSYVERATVPCAWEEKARVMRLLLEQVGDLGADCTDGVKIRHPEGWVLARPHEAQPAVDLIAEGRTQETAGRLLSLYAQQILQLRRRGA
ncbi:MAG TPA: sugar phosphate nucleotidyltransferase [Limnochordia bacterium]